MKKHFKKHDGFNACHGKRKDNSTEKWQDVKCGNCKKNGQYLQARQDSPIDHPNFRKALADKVDMKLEVTQAESLQAQKICFSCGVKWALTGKIVKVAYPFFIISTYTPTSIYAPAWATLRDIFDNNSSKQFSFKDDCFIDDVEILVDKLNVLSGCGKHLAEFFKCLNKTCSNVEVHISDEDINRGKSKHLFPGWYYVSNMGEFELSILIAENGLNKYRIEEPVELSACGRTLDEFMACVDDDCNNVENCHVVPYNINWILTFSADKGELINNIKTNGLQSYRIKDTRELDKAVERLAALPTPQIQYTITEEQMDEIRQIIKIGQDCKMDFVDDLQKMKDAAFRTKDISLFRLAKIFDKIEGK